jgi:hypothetical protein
MVNEVLHRHPFLLIGHIFDNFEVEFVGKVLAQAHGHQQIVFLVLKAIQFGFFLRNLRKQNLIELDYVHDQIPRVFNL